MKTRVIGFWLAVAGVAYLTPFAVKVAINKTHSKALTSLDNYVHGTGGA